MNNDNKNTLTTVFGTAAICAGIRATTTATIEVPCTNVERRLQLHQQTTGELPPRGSVIIYDLYKNGELPSLSTGTTPNVAKNIIREWIRAMGWVGVPIATRAFLSESTLRENPKIQKYSPVVVVIIINGTVNTLFDRVRNFQIDSKATSGIAYTTPQACREIYRQGGFFNFLRGGAITYAYSLNFWGVYTVSNGIYISYARKFGYDPDNNTKVRLATSAATGVTAGIAVHPLQIVRNAVLNGAVPPGVLPALRHFHTTQISQVGPRGYFTGITYAMPTQVIASVIAGVAVPIISRLLSQSSSRGL